MRCLPSVFFRVRPWQIISSDCFYIRWILFKSVDKFCFVLFFLPWLIFIPPRPNLASIHQKGAKMGCFEFMNYLK